MGTAIPIDEKELVKRLKSKNSASLDYLYDHYSSALYGIISRIIANEDVAEEVLQDVFLKIWNRIEQYDPDKGRLFTWMLNLARNQAIDKTRSKEISKSKKTTPIDHFVSTIEGRGSSKQNVDAIGLTDVLDKLSEDQKFVVTYLYLKGYTQSELAKEFDIPLGTVKTRLRMAMIALRTQLKVV
ncbi:MAG: sigma-70 family RNA polymerase sigma factor [Cyclobacteriaceae bacterium]